MNLSKAIIWGSLKFKLSKVKCFCIVPSIENTEDLQVLGTNTEQLYILGVVSEDWETEINKSSTSL